MQKSENLELLMSVMHQKDFSLAEESKIKGDLLMINQCEENRIDNCQKNGHTWRMVSTTERGLSNSRNMALSNATGDICKLCDDDETLVDGYEEIILNAYKELPDADVIVFNLNRINYSMKKSYYKINSIRIAPSYRSYGSPMITFRRNSIVNNGIKFNPLFGSGSKFGGGEDGLFLNEIRKAGLKIYEYPATISTIDYGRFESQWFHGYTAKYFYNIGVFHQFTNPNKWFSNIIWGFYQAFKLRNEQISPFFILKWRLLGAKNFKKGQLSYEEYIKSNGKFTND